MKNIYLIILVSLLNSSINAQTSLTTAVDFTVIDIHGETYSLFELLDSGKYVILDFFFTTCGPCQASVPILNQAYSDYGCNTSQVFFIAIDNGDSDAEVLQYEDDFGGLFPAVSGNDGGGNEVVSSYGISAYPTVVLIHPDRTILEQDIFPVSNITTALPSAGLNTALCDTSGTTAIVDEYLQNKAQFIYDCLGRVWDTSFENLPKGVYIINGKKVLRY